MNTPLLWALATLAIAAIPGVLFLVNWRLFQKLPATPHSPAAVSLLIPARNEAGHIRAAVESVLANHDIELELIVLDDASSDDTAAIVQSISQHDPRVRLASAPPLPADWCGKQHACQKLAELARFDLLIWIDADVRLSADSIGRMARAMEANKVSLLSGFPMQETCTPLESLLIPLMHFILLGFLPIAVMRRDNAPSLGAGCGQVFIARRADYFAIGGHAAIRQSLHDGIALPRAFRRAGKMTDIFDASDLARCRMYDSAAGVWNGLLKNAGEGIATPQGIVPWTVLLIGGQVLPWILVILFLLNAPGNLAATLVAIAAGTWGILIRILAASRFAPSRNPITKYFSAFLHPLGICLFLLIQWQSLFRRLTGHRSTWRGRSY
jgi:glycosyltransferase involved in cell wall biosynthesis